ncbi:hypothetical protein IFT56_13420 [Rhizobium sp. CFBP 13717]|nr:hypothetical protein [Rhizobium sp. CFBP 13717]MBD8688145.1 hypothetical protein [Rhizobium sp. CFBP 13644]MBD8692600.1 hypothetical protein [Rhizobium sp. CFBP 13717]
MKTHEAKDIVTKRRQVDVLNAQCNSVAQIIRSIGVTEGKDYRWSAE